MIIGLILAGGEGRRMKGATKPEVCLGGMPLIEHVIKRLTPQTDKLFISGRQSYGTDLAYIPDATDAYMGPVGGIQASFKWLLSEFPDLEGVLLSPCDVPFLPESLLSELQSSRVSVAHDGIRLHPTLSWWPCADMALALKHIEEGGVRSLHGLLEACQMRVVPFNATQAFANINTPDDLKAAEQRLAL